MQRRLRWNWSPNLQVMVTFLHLHYTSACTNPGYTISDYMNSDYTNPDYTNPDYTNPGYTISDYSSV